jgi:hypothetical protein
MVISIQVYMHANHRQFQGAIIGNRLDKICQQPRKTRIKGMLRVTHTMLMLRSRSRHLLPFSSGCNNNRFSSLCGSEFGNRCNNEWFSGCSSGVSMGAILPVLVAGVAVGAAVHSTWL